MGLLLLQGSAALNPRELFANGEQGLWLDPSQMSTLYQDSNGVTPCTAAGDPVGLILDQSRGGLSQIGAELVTNGTFAADSDWTKGANWTIGSGVATKTGGAANNLTQTIGSTAAAWYRISLDVTRSAGTLTVSLGTSGTTYAITATGSYTFFILAGSGTQTLTLAGDSSFAGTVDNVVVRNVPGNHAYQSTSGQRPTLQTSGGLWYLSFDGTDDSLVTNSVDFTATDEMTVIAGVRKVAATDYQLLVELSANVGANNGSIGIFAPYELQKYWVSSRGSANAVALSDAFSSPVSHVLSVSADISGDSLAVRVNATSAATSATDQGSGNYGNHILYIGRRGGTTLPYNGHLYQLIIRGKTTSTGKLLEAERFVARKTGVSF